MVIATIVFFAEVQEWHWHYDPFLDSLYLTASSHFLLYMFFYRTFAIPLLSPLFDPPAPFYGVLLYMAHLIPVPPHQAPLPQLAHPASSESDPSEWMESSSSSSSSSAPGDRPAPTDHRPVGIIPNGFLSSELG